MTSDNTTNDQLSRKPARAILLSGFLRGLKTGGDLLKIMLPIFAVVTFLRHTVVVPFMQEHLASVMSIFALPGEAAVPIVTGFFSDEYGVVAAAAGFGFSAAGMTTIAMITLCFHTIPLEAAIGSKIGFNPVKFTIYRLVLAVLTGMLVGQLLVLIYAGAGDGAGMVSVAGGADAIMGATDATDGADMATGAANATSGAASAGGAGSAVSTGNAVGTGSAAGGVNGPSLILFSISIGDITVTGWMAVLLEILLGSLGIVLSLARIIIPLMIGIEFMLSYKVVERIAPRMRWFCRITGISDDALLPMLIGLLMGVTYGAGTLMEINRRAPLPARDMRLIGIFLYACHGIIETTVLFAVAGANVFFVGVVRLVIAVAITAVAARLPLFRS